MLRILAAAAFLAAIPSAHAQTAPQEAPAPDPARLAVAKVLIEKFLPSSRRDAMIEQMLRPMFNNMHDTMISSPMFGKASDPELATRIDAFVKTELERSIDLTKASMPAMADAMARAYARRFTLDQLKALDAFFETPAGRAYAEQAPSLMSDPDILAAQRAMMAKAMNGLEQRAAAFAAQAAPDGKKDD